MLARQARVQLALEARRQEAQQPQAVLVLERRAEQRLEPERQVRQVQLELPQRGEQQPEPQRQRGRRQPPQPQGPRQQQEWQQQHPGCFWRSAGRTSSARCSTKEAQGWAALQQDLPRATA